MTLLRKIAQKNSYFIILLILAGIGQVYAKTNKKVIYLDDVKLWRNSKVTLSDNGEWYTVLYSLAERPIKKKNLKSSNENDKKQAGLKKDKDFYGRNARTDVLYVCNAGSNKEYAICNGIKPVFSSDSAWIAYSIVQADITKNSKKDSKEIIELKNLKNGETKKWNSGAKFRFTKDGRYFVSFDKDSLLLCNLKTQREYYIGNIGEYSLNEKSNLIAYTIKSKDRRGNGIYIYNLQTYTTLALETGNYIYTNLSWNKDKSALAAFKYRKSAKDILPEDTRVLVFTGVGNQGGMVEYKLDDATGLPDYLHFAVRKEKELNKIFWSSDNKRLFFNARKNFPDKNKQKDAAKNFIKAESTVNVWHWKDKKLVSQQLVESAKEIKKVFKLVFNLDSAKVLLLTSEEIQQIFRSAGTDKWAVGTDNRAYISDWDVERNDLYRIDLNSGAKKLILKNYSGSINISPAGDGAVFWKGGQYFYYNFNRDSLISITTNLAVSFIDREYDQWGASPAYGFVGWVNDCRSIILKHEFDLWQVFLDNKFVAINLTEHIRDKAPIRFRWEDLSFKKKEKVEERYIDLSVPVLLNAFNVKTKFAGYYRLLGKELTQLVYRPVSFKTSRWRPSGLIRAKKSDVIVFKMGSYQEYPESYLSNLDFKKPKKITCTNPQQSKYKWGHRILINYANDDGVSLQGILSIPDDYKRGQHLPMVVYSYEKLSDNMFRYADPRISGSSLCEMMYVSDGYLFLQPDIHFNVGTPHSDMHECIEAAINKVIELGYVDAKRIGYEGFSFGGHCGMYISTQKNKFAAIAAGAGVSNLFQGFSLDIVGDGSNEQDYYMTQQGRLGAGPTVGREMYIRESAVFNAEHMNTPLLLFHGTADSVVQWEHSFGLYSILRFLKKPVIFLSYRGEGHGLRQKTNRWDIQKRLKEYFDYYLKGRSAAEWITTGVPVKSDPELTKKKTASKLRRTVPVWK
jgi:dienelactone hydrolase